MLASVNEGFEAGEVWLEVSVGERTLAVWRGDAVVHRFPVGVGTGTELAGWTFETPTGEFTVGRMKKDPVWYAPAWHYVEQGLPVPPEYSPERYVPGALGDYALYLTDEIAIHGTRDAGSVGRASSHGCLRMTNDAMALLYTLVEIGTPVRVTP